MDHKYNVNDGLRRKCYYFMRGSWEIICIRFVQNDVHFIYRQRLTCWLCPEMRLMFLNLTCFILLHLLDYHMSSCFSYLLNWPHFKIINSTCFDVYYHNSLSYLYVITFTWRVSILYQHFYDFWILLSFVTCTSQSIKIRLTRPWFITTQPPNTWN